MALAVLLAWLTMRESVETVDGPAPARSDSLVSPAAAHVERAASAEPVEPREVKEAAVRALAAASGRFAVVCPPRPPPPQHCTETGWHQPEGAICTLAPGILCAASEPAGSVVIWCDNETPVAAYRWDTAQDGTTTCVPESLRDIPVLVRVVDAQAAPLEGVSVMSSGLYRSAITDRDGWANLLLPHGGRSWVLAISDDGAVSAPVGVEAGGAAVIVLRDPPADVDPGNVMAEIRMSRSVEAIEDLEAALEASPPEVGRELGGMLDAQVRGMDVGCEDSDVPTCRAWNARR
jgi:hypothetical protein